MDIKKEGFIPLS